MSPKLGGDGDGDFVRGFRATYGTCMVGLMIVYDAAVGDTGSPRRSGEEEEETDDPPVMTGATGRKLRGGGYCTSSTLE